MASGRLAVIAKKAWALLKQIWPAFVVLATLVAFRNDWLQFWRDIRSGSGTWLWVLLAVIIVALWLAAWHVSRTPHLGDWLQRLDVRFIRWGARALLVILPLVAVAVVVWWVSPPKQTVVLVADFVDPTGVDSARVTQSLVDGMRETLQGHTDVIEVKRLNQTFETEGGSDHAQRVGRSPLHKAAFVVWGDYTLEPDPELHVHFDILRQTETYLGKGTAEDYGPMQIRQPTMFDFKLSLSNYLGELTAFASGLALYDAGDHHGAVSLFDTAAQAIGQELSAKWERAIRFYRGTNLLTLDLALEAKTDLEALIPNLEDAIVTYDEAALVALNNLGVAAKDLGEYESAKAYLERSLVLYRQLGYRLGEAGALSNLGMVVLNLGDYPGAETYLQQSLALSRQLGDRFYEAAALGNLGLMASDLGDYPKAKVYLEQSLALSRQLGDRLSEAHALSNLGRVAREEKHYARARTYSERALSLHRQLGNHLGEANDLGNLGLVAFELHEYLGAEAYLQQSLSLFRQLGNRLGEARSLQNLGVVMGSQSPSARAKPFLDEALALFRQVGNRRGEAEALANLGQVALDERNFAKALAYMGESVQLYQKIGVPIPPTLQSALNALKGQE